MVLGLTVPLKVAIHPVSAPTPSDDPKMPETLESLCSRQEIARCHHLGMNQPIFVKPPTTDYDLVSHLMQIFVEEGRVPSLEFPKHCKGYFRVLVELRACAVLGSGVRAQTW